MQGRDRGGHCRLVGEAPAAAEFCLELESGDVVAGKLLPHPDRRVAALVTILDADRERPGTSAFIATPFELRQLARVLERLARSAEL